MENGSFLLHLTPNVLERDETRSLRIPSRNLAQTNAFRYISLDVNLATQAGISRVHF